MRPNDAKAKDPYSVDGTQGGGGTGIDGLCLPETMLGLPLSVLSKLPPLLMQSGDADDLTKSSMRARTVLQRAGVKSALEVYPGFHGFLGTLGCKPNQTQSCI